MIVSEFPLATLSGTTISTTLTIKPLILLLKNKVLYNKIQRVLKKDHLMRNLMKNAKLNCE